MGNPALEALLARLAQKLLKLRTGGNWDQQSVAREAGVSVSQLRRFESGRFGVRGPTLGMLSALAGALDAELVLDLVPVKK